MISMVVAIESLPLEAVYEAEHAGPLHPLKLAVAVALPELAGTFSEKQLRTAIENGLLPAEQHGRTLYVTRAGIAKWRQNCLVRNNQPDFGSAQPGREPRGQRSGPQSGSSSTMAARSALDAALSIASALRKPTRTI